MRENSVECPHTWVKVSLNEGQDGVAGGQVLHPHALEVLLHLGLSEQLVEL